MDDDNGCEWAHGGRGSARRTETAPRTDWHPGRPPRRYAPRLVRFYQRLGFRVVAQARARPAGSAAPGCVRVPRARRRLRFRPQVGSGVRDIPHLLVWGAVGTRMDADIPALLAQWGRAVRRDGGGGVR